MTSGKPIFRRGHWLGESPKRYTPQVDTEFGKCQGTNLGVAIGNSQIKSKGRRFVDRSALYILHFAIGVALGFVIFIAAYGLALLLERLVYG